MATEQMMTGQWVNLLDNVALGAGVNGSQFAVANKLGGTRITWQTRFTTPPGAISMRLQGMVDPTSGIWADLDAGVVATGEIRTTGPHNVSLIRARIETFAGGDFVTVEAMVS